MWSIFSIEKQIEKERIKKYALIFQFFFKTKLKIIFVYELKI